MTAKLRVLVVGAGIAGAVTANNLVKYGLDVTVVEPSEHHVYQPGLVDYLVGDARTDEIIRPVDSVLNKGVKLVRDKAVKLDLKDRKVMTSGGKELSYDYLVLAPGVVNKGSPSWHTLNEIDQIRKSLDATNPKRVVISYKLPVKCPAAPFEMASLIKLIRPKGEVTLLIPVKEPPPLQRKMSQTLVESISRLGVNVVRGAEVQEVNSDNKVVKTDEGSYEYDLLLFDHPISAPPEFAEVAVDKGFVPVDRETLRVKGYPEVFAVGDVNNITSPPKNGAAAHFQAMTAVSQILAETLGNVEAERYKGQAMCAVYAGDKGAFVFMNYEGSYVYPPSPLWRTMKRAFTDLYWATLSGGVDSAFNALSKYFSNRVEAIKPGRQ
ncbi:MAG: FAD-dependent oxidoreductase [Sulfolobales archaeon]|nr:FAD-dependent oxidoreductase [Sulfolobales archaeon]